ncbi:YggS family pyridoxal phosphate-dependent enzyme [Terrimonas pollutisoli]|uniref:YggS family pyridoxal phosphate-dependent enzyme n=1 Tax=Terrimonas pollutisoli TaxID=3034147 RepID=UPI0023EAE875|nr:YggS family pyridoxal phosphate-dependent enzyme [Terrimonas sp. H1YJ31]
MAINKDAYQQIISELQPKNITLVAVSKTKPVTEIQEMYELGQRDFGENYVQELADKESQLPKDIRWHFIGHLQSNKVKYIAPFVHLIHGVDSFKLLNEVNKQALKYKRVIDVLLQVHIAQEETKFGMNEAELKSAIDEFEKLKLENVRICGLMGMASFTDNETTIKKEFQFLKGLFDKHAKLPIANCQLQILSMGMSSDYKIAIEEGSNMVRIGSLLFGERNYQ